MDETNSFRQVFVKVLGGGGTVSKRTITVDIEVARSSQMLTKHLKGLIPPNAVGIEIRKNGRVLRDHHEVR